MKKGELNPALTHTLEEFIAMRNNDDLTYFNFSIIEKINGIKLLDHNLIEDYLDELVSISINCELNRDQYNKYKYSPDLLSYDVYGTTQLDFVILLINDMIDPKEFDLKTIKLPYASKMKLVMQSIYNSEQDYINQNRHDNEIPSYL